jgi:L,D-transpeptidase YcbB
VATRQVGRGLRSLGSSWRALITGLLIAIAARPAGAQDSVGAVIRGLVVGEVEMSRLYASRGWAPLWVDGHEVTRQGRAALGELLATASHGLDPTDYNGRVLDSMAGRVGRARASPLDLARLDLLLSLSMCRYLEDLHTGRARLFPFAGPAAKQVDWVAALAQGVAGDSIPRLVEASEPRLTQYRNLRLLLARYRTLTADSTVPVVPSGPVVLPGQPYADAEVLRRRLRLEGDMSPGGQAPSPAVYDDSLLAALRRFQLRHGLRVDGRLGPRTLAELNTPLPHRVHQIELALERLRWLPRLSDHPFVVVNIPAFQLFAFDSAGGAGTPSLTMKVVVGKSMDTRTPMLFERMRYVEFRPSWNVPRSILLAEILPQLQRHPEYLRRHKMEVVTSEGRRLGDNASPKTLGRLAKGELGVRQSPGPSNALGLVKFAFPNTAGVYMHGTPETELFSQARRDFSHGCIRIEDPAAFAAWVLRFQTGWPPERIAAAMEGTATLRVPLARTLNVAVYYTTVVATPEGAPQFYPDIYDRDAALTELLRRARPVPPTIAGAPPPG